MKKECPYCGEEYYEAHMFGHVLECGRKERQKAARLAEPLLVKRILEEGSAKWLLSPSWDSATLFGVYQDSHQFRGGVGTRWEQECVNWYRAYVVRGRSDGYGYPIYILLPSSWHPRVVLRSHNLGDSWMLEGGEGARRAGYSLNYRYDPSRPEGLVTYVEDIMWHVNKLAILERGLKYEEASRTWYAAYWVDQDLDEES